MSSRAISAFVELVLRHPRRAAVAGLVVMLLSVAAATRIRLADDARALVAEGDPVVARQLEALSDFTTVDNLLLHLDSQGHPEELEPAGRFVVDALHASGAFQDARFEAEPARQLELASALMPRRFVLDPRPPDALVMPETLARSLAETREAVLSPQGIVTKAWLLRDPLGSLAASLRGLGSAPGFSRLDASSGRFLSQDGGSLLVISVPRGNPFAGSDAGRTMAVVRDVTARLTSIAPHVVVRPIGAHRFAFDAQRMVQSDVHLNTLTTALAIVAIFLFFFRKPRLLLVAFPPLLFGTALAAGIAGLWGGAVHGIVLAFAGACLGLAVDYTVYLVTSSAAVGGSPRSALPVATRKIGRSLWLAMATTVAGLLALLASRIPAIRQMGVLALGAVGGSFVGALLWVPIILPVLAPHGPATTTLPGPWTWTLRQSLTRPRRVVALACAVALVLGVAGALGTRLDGELRHLDTHDAAARADETAFTRAFGDADTAGLALVEGRTLDEALTRATDAESRLRAAGFERVVSVTSLAPPSTVARARRHAWCEARERVVQALRGAGVAHGFKATAFATFEADLDALCAPAGEALLAPEPALAAFAAILGRPVYRPSAGGVRLAVPFEATDLRFPAAQAAVSGVAGAAVIHRQALNARLVELVGEDLPRLAGLSLGLVALLLLVSFRSVRKTLFALAPCVLAVATFLGVFALAGTPLNIMNLSVFALLNGAGVDYGILMVDTDPKAGPQEVQDRGFGVVVASLTTLAGFGSLATAHYYAIATIGHAVLLAIGAAALYALVVTPALVAWSADRRARRERLAGPGT